MAKEDVLVKMNLVGLDGNAMSIIGAFQRQAKLQGFTEKDIKEIVSEAMEGDYEQLIRTIMEHIC